MRITFAQSQFVLLEESLRYTQLQGLLWVGLVSRDRMVFQFCSAHWLDLARLCGLRAVQHQRSDWFAVGGALLRVMCHASSWDPKEIANLLRWQTFAST